MPTKKFSCFVLFWWLANGKEETLSKYHIASTAATVGLEFQGTSPQEGADIVMRQLSAEQIEYAADPERGQYRGFAALHDLMDANMLIPFAEGGMADENRDEFFLFANAVMDEVSRRIIAGANPI